MFFALAIAFTGIVLVAAYGSNNPSYFGHSPGEMDEGTFHGDYVINGTLNTTNNAAFPRVTAANITASNFMRIQSNGVGFYWTATVSSSTNCDTSCSDNDAVRGFNLATGACIQSWGYATGTPLSCSSTDGSGVSCLCAGYSN